ncbi:MAG TPA: hypothetical protein VMT10_05265 [Solirubrobacteraceae bacterium]|nr:hypothetical protein [Solirubrobacteraceae bacterium]
MYLAFVTALALSLWVTLTALGRSSIDGFLLALVIILIAAGVRALNRARDPRDG